jgi:putative colanic acid biosynthesis UDP-glucose lipid carrier transferase
MVTIVQRLIDLILISGSLWVSVFLSGLRWDTNFWIAALWSAVLFALLAEFNDLYHSWRIQSSSRREFYSVLMVWIWVLFGLLLVAYATETTTQYPQEPILMWFLLASLSLVVWRVIFREMLGIARRQGMNTRTAAIAGRGKAAVELWQNIAASPWMGLRLLGFYEDENFPPYPGLTMKGFSLKGSLDDLVALSKKGRVDYVFIAMSMREEARIQDLIERLADTTASVYLVPDLFIYDLMQGRWSHIGEVPTLSIFESPFSGAGGIVKRFEDLIFGAIFLTLAALPMLLIGIGVKLTSPGPTLFKQRRYGLHGEEIEVWKFRTMTVCEDGDQIHQAKRHDVRVTPFGRFLRRTSLDELPQLINVLQGRMSLVGPRPHAVAHNEHYRTLIKGYMLRHKVKPGITGWAQVNGWRGETETLTQMEKRVEHDLVYIREWSFWFDVKIILLTISHGFINKNAY